MSEIAIPGPTSVANPATGELISLEDPAVVAVALDEIRQLEDRLKYAKRILGERLAEESRVRGEMTMFLPGVKVTLAKKKEIRWDMGLLKQLLDLGLPKTRYDELVRQTVEVKVMANEAKKIAAANPQYKEIIEEARSDHEGDPYVTSIERARS
jgi:PAS domain-containing protein